MKKLKFNLQLFAEDFAELFAKNVGVGVEAEKVAEPPTEPSNIQEPAQDSVSDGSDKVDEHKEKSETSAVTDEKPPRDLEKDSAFAKLRREKEALEKAQKERDTWYAEQFKDYGITTEAEYRQKVSEQRQAELLEQAETGDINAIEQLADLKAEEKATQALQTEKMKMQLQSEVLDLNREFDLNLKSFDEIAEMENGAAVIALMSAKKPDGEYFSAVEAYKMANYDKIMSKEVQKAKQQVKNELNGFNHTKVENKAGSEVQDVTLGADVMAEFDKWGMKPNMDLIKKLIK